MSLQLAMSAYGLHTARGRVMASIWQDERSGKWVVGFVFGGKHFVRSCRTKTKTKAYRTKAVVEETLEMLNTGRLVMPADANPGVLILSGG
jgi:hypothetical protein